MGYNLFAVPSQHPYTWILDTGNLGALLHKTTLKHRDVEQNGSLFLTMLWIDQAFKCLTGAGWDVGIVRRNSAASRTWLTVGAQCQLGAQWGLLAGDLCSPPSGSFSCLIGLPHNMAAGVQEGMFQQVKMEDAILLHRVLLLCSIG